mgnify:CR=1 FL=1
MAGGNAIYEKYLREKEFRPIAMQVLAAGALKPREAIEYLGKFSKIESVLFGASSQSHIRETKELIDPVKGDIDCSLVYKFYLKARKTN